MNPSWAQIMQRIMVSYPDHRSGYKNQVPSEPQDSTKKLFIYPWWRPRLYFAPRPGQMEIRMKITLHYTSYHVVWPDLDIGRQQQHWHNAPSWAQDALHILRGVLGGMRQLCGVTPQRGLGDNCGVRMLNSPLCHLLRLSMLHRGDRLRLVASQALQIILQ